MIQILNLLPIAMLMLATSVSATARYANFYQDDNCKTTGSAGFKMGNPGCFNLGHAFSYTTGNRDEPGSAPEGRWCLIKFRDDVCNCIDDYEVVGLKKGDDNICHALAPDPYHGSYQWYKMDVTGTGKCPTSGCFEDKSVVESVPDADKRSVGHEITSEDVWANSYVGVLGKRRLEVELD